MDRFSDEDWALQKPEDIIPVINTFSEQTEEDSKKAEGCVYRRKAQLINGKIRVDVTDSGKLVFTGDFYDNFSGKLNFYPLHPEKAELLQEQKNIAVDNAGLLEKNGLIGIRRNFAFPTTRYVIKHELRFCPGMVFDRCFQVCVDGVKLHHAAGMGILFQQSGDIEVCRTQIVPRGRRASVSDDALHLTECRGKIRVADSIFAGTLDDNINIHSVYRPLKERIPGTRFHYLDTGHYQQAGLPGAYPGDTLELVKNDTGRPYGRLKLTGTRVLTKTFTLVNFAPEELPAEFLKQAEPTVDKVALKRYIKDSGEIVPGTNVTIRRGARFR
jgi:hypothetical protein